jgi:hypothetical protein
MYSFAQDAAIYLFLARDPIRVLPSDLATQLQENLEQGESIQ